MFFIQHEWIFVLGKFPIKLNKTEVCKTAGAFTMPTNREKDGSLTKGIGVEIGEYKQMGTMIRTPPHRTGINGNKEHPAVFPIKLPENFILATSDKNEIIVDPFLGYGTTLIASEKTNRKCYGMEISERYCDLTVQRFADFTNQSDNIYLERDGEKIPYSTLVDLNPIL